MTKTISLLAVVVALLLPAHVLACSCAQPPKPKKALAQSGAVFTGTITDVSRVDAAGARTPFDPARDLPAIDLAIRANKPFPTDRVEVTFAVDRAWKGVDAATAVVTSGIPVCCICLIPFTRGESWMIYADKAADGSLSTSRCTRTTELANAKSDIAALGRPAHAFNAVAGTEPFTTSELDAARKVSEEFGRMLLAKAGEDFAKLLVTKDALKKVLPEFASKVDASYVALVDGNLALFAKRKSVLGDTSSLTFQGFEAGTLTSSTSYVAGTRIMKNARITLGQQHRVTITVNVEEMILVDGRAYIVKID